MVDITLYNLAGTVTDAAGQPAIGRTVRVYKRSDGSFYGEMQTNSKGEFYFKCDGTLEYTVICMPKDGEDSSNAKIFDNIKPTPYKTIVATSHIGTPGTIGFGVGTCPDTVPDMVPLDGFDDPTNENYGNYRCTVDDSIMVWIPAFYFKWGTGANGLAMNKVLVKDYSIYATEAEANADGFALHRAFIDGGQIKKGFFIDKYLNSKHPTKLMPSSHYMRLPIVMNSPSYDLFQVPRRAECMLDIIKKRGADFHLSTIFIYNAMNMLTFCHGQAVSDTSACAWYSLTENYPVYNSNGQGGSANGLKPEFRSMPGADFSGPNYAGTWNIPAGCTHNGQKSGVAELSGSLYEAVIGLTWNFGFWGILKESVNVKTLQTSLVVSSSNQNSLYNDANFDNMGTNLPNTLSTSTQYLDDTKSIFGASVDRTNADYKYKCCGIPQTGSIKTTVNTSMRGVLYFSKPNGAYLFPGAAFSSGASGGMWALRLADAWDRAESPNTGIRAARYL